MKDTKYHTPVMVEEVLEYLQPKAGKTYLDVTFGGGGHTKSILDANEECNVIGLDWDLNSIDKQGEKLEEVYGDRLHLLWGNFAQLYRIFKKAGIKNDNKVIR